MVKKLIVVLSFISASVSATVDFSHSEVVNEAQDGSYSVKMSDGSVWRGVTESELTAQQIKGYQMQQALLHAQHVNHYGVKGHLNLTPQINPGTINVAVSSLHSEALIQTPNGIVKAGSLPPDAQVAVPFNGAFNQPLRRGGDHGGMHSGVEHGTGNGGNNAANSTSAHGLGGDNHIGGGAAQSGSRGHW